MRQLLGSNKFWKRVLQTLSPKLKTKGSVYHLSDAELHAKNSGAKGPGGGRAGQGVGALADKHTNQKRRYYRIGFLFHDDRPYALHPTPRP